MSVLFGGNKTSQAQQQTVYTGILLQSSIYGACVPIVYGQTRVAGNIIWYGDFQSFQVSEGGGGGKGGLFGSNSGGNEYNYSASFAMGICEGPIESILNVWIDPTSVSLASLGLTGFDGTYPQTPWSYLTSNFPSQALPYGGQAYVAAENYGLGSSPSLPNFNFEVQGILWNTFPNGYDANPAEVISDFLTNLNYGVGFPSGMVSNFSVYSNYCLALGIGISPSFDTQQDAASQINDILQATNSEAVWSEGVLNIVPYGDEAISGNGGTYTPPSSPLFSLNDDDFLTTGTDEDPVVMSRSRTADQINDIQFEFLNRSVYYNIQTVEVKDQASIEVYGLRNTNSFDGHFICDPTMAMTAATLMLQRQYVRNTYEFTLGWQYILLDPMDIISITDVNLGLNDQWVRIISIEEDDSGNLKFTAEEYLDGTGSAALYTFQDASRPAQNYNISPGNAATPVIFEIPGTYDGVTNCEVYIGASGGSNWGGADVWISSDNITYTKQGRLIGAARYGVTTTSLGAAPAMLTGLDTTNSLGVDLTVSGGTLAGSTYSDAANFGTLALVGSGTTAELISYETATLTATNKYTLSNLGRGGYETDTAGQSSGVPFVRIDQSLVSIPISSNEIGTPFYIKLTSFNTYGGGEQSISSVSPYIYTPTGLALTAALPNVTNLVSAYVGGFTVLQWTAVTDPRNPDYEIRKGATWATAIVLGRTKNFTNPIQGDDTYWVAAHAQPIPGVDVYSENPTAIVISGATLEENVIVSYDEAATGWSGTLNNVATTGGGANLYLPATDSSGYYEIPSGHIINAGRVCDISLNVIFSAYAELVADDVLAMSNVLTNPNILALADGNNVSVVAQIQTAQATGGYSSWVQYQPGVYTAQYVNLRIYFENLDPLQQTFALLSNFSFLATIPDITQTGTNVSISSGGTTIPYSEPFNATPNLQTTILNASAGDDVIITSSSSTGFTVQIKNGGSGVARNINWVAQGY